MGVQFNPTTGQMEFVPEKIDFSGSNPYAEQKATEPAIQTPATKQLEAGTATKDSKTDLLAKLLTGAGAASANPYIAGAGLVLQAAATIQDDKRQAAMDIYNAKVADYNARQQQYANLAQITQGLRV